VFVLTTAFSDSSSGFTRDATMSHFKQGIEDGRDAAKTGRDCFKPPNDSLLDGCFSWVQFQERAEYIRGYKLAKKTAKSD
jgi:hypothetical protein